MYTYVNPTVTDPNRLPDIAVIHAGTNDISFRSTKSPKDIAASILQIGTKCRDAGVNNILISSITKRKNFGLQKIINEVNDFLADGCNINRFTFINNSNIVESDICQDRLHLSHSGTCKLANNINTINYTNDI